MRIMVTGGRKFSDAKLVKDAFVKWCRPGDIIVNGGCNGADHLCVEEARSMDLLIETHFADWNLGKKAGPIRNREMANSNIDFCIAFPGGKGTANAIEECEKAGVSIFIAENLL